MLAAFLLYLRRFFEPMQELSQFYTQFQGAAAALEKLAGVLDEAPAVPEPEHPVRAARAEGRRCRSSTCTSPTRSSRSCPISTVDIPAGETLALVGATGAGKTTIARLMARFYDPTSGRVTLDGVDLRDLSDEELRRAVVMVTQDNFLFSGTVADNIGFGRPDASRAEIEDAARAIGAHDFIARAARRLRHRHPEARRAALGRAAPARRVRPCVPRAARGADPRRGHVVARHPERTAGAERAAHPARATAPR